MALTIEELSVFCKKKGFVFPSSEIYGGLAGFWDYGPLGVELINNLKSHWWKFFVQDRENMVGIDASIISHPKVWKASGHLANFNDVSVQCKKCKKYSKVDKAELGKATCSFCQGELLNEAAKELNLMFQTSVGPITELSQAGYLRPETAQAMFLNFRLIAETSRVKLPFGVAQIGKSFRNEIAPRDFLFRDREFNLAEFEFFLHPEKLKCPLLEKRHLQAGLRLLDAKSQEEGKDGLQATTIGQMLKEKMLNEWHAYWLAEQLVWFNELGLSSGIKVREHMKNELSHYSSATFDLDFAFPFGSKELAGIANRGQFDLTQHMKESKQNLEIFDEETKQKVVPAVIEPTFGIDRIFLAVLANAYHYDKERGNIVLRIHPKLAPVKAGVFPLVNKLEDKAREVFDTVKLLFPSQYDRSGSIGRRYARADEIGIPFCVTVDFDTLKDNSVTIRDRDTTEQVRVKASELGQKLACLISGVEKLSSK